MADGNDYFKQLTEALSARREYLESVEFSKLRGELRSFQSAFEALFRLLVNKGLVNEDPYKDETQMTALKVPPTTAFTDVNELGIRLSEEESQLDFLINFYEFKMENFGQGQIKKILGLVRYIEWTSLSPDSKSPCTAAMASIVNQARRANIDVVSAKVIVDSLSTLSKTTSNIVAILKEFNDYNRELYKFDIRDKITSQLGKDADAGAIKKQWTKVFPKRPFFNELAEEVIREDFSSGGEKLQEKALKSLQNPNDKAKEEKKAVSLKPLVIASLNELGLAATIVQECYDKMENNSELYQARKVGLFQSLARALGALFGKKEEDIEYQLEYIDPPRPPRRDVLNYTRFTMTMEKKVKILMAIGPRGSAAGKLQAMNEEELVSLADKNIKDLLSIHKTLTALDDFFKKNIDRNQRARIKGIRPELVSIKGAVSKARERLQDYQSQIEEARQFKKLGIDTGVELPPNLDTEKKDGKAAPNGKTK
jgi:type III secretion system FlhB-like substrate exporter